MLHCFRWESLVRYAALFLFMLVFWNMVVTTLIGLLYLTERMHRPSGRWEGEPVPPQSGIDRTS